MFLFFSGGFLYFAGGFLHEKAAAIEQRP